MKANQKLSVLFFLNRKKASRDGLAPIYARVTIESQKEEFSLSIKSALADWDNEKKRVSGKSQQAQHANLKIDQTRSKLEHLFIILCEEHEDVSPLMLINTFRRPKTSPTKKIEIRESETNFNKLKERIDAAAKKAFSYFAEMKKAKKIRNEMALNHRMAELDDMKRMLTNEIEKLVGLANAHFAATDIKWTVVDAMYEFLLFYLRKVMNGNRAITSFRRWAMTKNKLNSFIWYHYKKTTLSWRISVHRLQTTCTNT